MISPSTVLKLRQIRDAIIDEPERFQMKEWACDTAMCIAGWAIHFDDPEASPIIIDGRCCRQEHFGVLGLDRNLHGSLFYVEDWPYEFKQAWDLCSSTRARAYLAAAVIEHFIQEETGNATDR